MAGQRRGPAKKLPTGSPAPKAAKRPPDLSEDAARFWDTYAPRMLKAGHLSDRDFAGLEAAARAWGEYLRFDRMLSSGDAEYVQYSDKGVAMTTAEVWLRDSAEKKVYRWLREYEMTPRTRKKEAAPTAESSADPIESRLRLVM